MWNITRTALTTEDGNTRETYGIAKGDTVINDVSVNEGEISELIERLNSLDVSEVHAYEVVEDFLGK